MRDQLGQIIRFGVVGGINTGTFFGCYLLLHPWMPYFAAYTLAFLLSMVGSFFLNTYFTYRTRPTWKKFALFPLTNVTNYVVQSAGLYALVTWAGMDDRIAPLVAAVVAIPFTYVISRRILVSRGPVPEGAGAPEHDGTRRRGGPELGGTELAGPAPTRPEPTAGPERGGPEGGMEERRPSRLA
ncbi:GtrA family protein [Streptomyces sp. NPDC056049]|uniref:GtrA family protein n=1 Tax=Streptomyces sp. NPDC056049 TaxID=3345693 RepID=UPI0035DAA210